MIYKNYNTTLGVMMKKIIFIVLILLVFTLIRAEKIAEFDLLVSGSMSLSQNSRCYVLYSHREGLILIYDRQTMKQTAKFGKIGEAPGEFLGGIVRVMLDLDRLYVSSRGRISFFDLNGRHIRDTRISPNDHIKGFISENFLVENLSLGKDIKELSLVVTLRNQEMKELKILLEQEMPYGPNAAYRVAPFESYAGAAYDDRHIVVYDPRVDGLITILDAQGNQLVAIRHPFEKIPVTTEDKEREKKAFMDSLANNPYMKQNQEKIEYVFPDEYPPFIYAVPDRERILVRTYKTESEHMEFLCFHISGKYLGVIRQPKKQVGDLYQGYFYRLEENEETEMYELHRWPVAEPQL